MIEDTVLSEDDISFYHLEKLCNYADGEVYGRENERYLIIKDKTDHDLYNVIIKYEATT